MATSAGVTGGNSVSQSDLPAWYQQYTQNLGQQAMGIAQGNNMQPLPAQSTAGFNSDQTAAFDAVRGSQNGWQAPLQQSAGLTSQIAPTAAKFIDYAQGAVGAPAMTTADSIQPWAQGAQDAVSGNAQSWTDNVSKYMSPYTSNVVDNIARLGKRNWENTIMPGVNSSMIGSGQFGSTRNADILSRAGMQAADDITGQQSNALQAGYNSGAAIFGQDAGRAQQQQKMQGDMALSGGNLMQGALSGDAGRIQNQGQIQANTALQGATGAVNALNTGSDNLGALGQSFQNMSNTGAQSLLNIGNQQQQFQQGALTTGYNNAMQARQDPWTQLSNATGVINGVQLPQTNYTSQSGQVGVPASLLSGAGAALLTGAAAL